MPIQILPARLANQIAAGEVVERPASVVKELVENSLDSGASKIDIEIEKGGHKRILIRDDGCGIPEPELSLALSRHATSKISCLDDLEAICSLGFRGEALASISSVARLTISSKPQAQQQAWQAFCEGRDMAVQVNPVAHPNGTSVDVVDLFFNTPARRKFLKTEKTEFAHIDEIVRRIALSRFDVGFTLKHNNKVLRKYPAVSKQGNSLKRIESVCGKGFAEQSIELNSHYQQFELTGWIVPIEPSQNATEFQYFYVNGRMMRDKLINHALRQAVEEIADTQFALSYVLYLTLPADQLDVNVHPAKHEVRFHQARLVHDFIYRALVDGLKQYLHMQLGSSENSEFEHDNLEPRVLAPTEPKHDYIQPLVQVPSQKIDESRGHYAYTPTPVNNAKLGAHSPSRKVDTAAVQKESFQRYQELMTAPDSDAGMNVSEPGQWLRIDDELILVSLQGQQFLLKIKTLHKSVLMALFQKKLPVSQPLLMPVSIDADAALLDKAKSLYQGLLDNSIEIGWTPNRIILRKVPANLRHFAWADSLGELLMCNNDNANDVREHLLNMVSVKNLHTTHQQIQDLWAGFTASHSDLMSAISKIATRVPLKIWLAEQDLE